MDIHRLEQLHRSLRSLVDSYKTTIELIEGALALLAAELALEPLSYFQSHALLQVASTIRESPLVDCTLFSVNYQGKACFLGNSLPFRFLARLVKRPNTYVSYEDLLADVWGTQVSDAAVRSVAKALRQKLRRAGLADLADAVDGTVSGHYALKIDS